MRNKNKVILKLNMRGKASRGIKSDKCINEYRKLVNKNSVKKLAQGSFFININFRIPCLDSY